VSVERPPIDPSSGLSGLCQLLLEIQERRCGVLGGWLLFGYECRAQIVKLGIVLCEVG
jgi:hypothetical protein